MAHALQQKRQKFLIHRVVFGHQYPQADGFFGWYCIGRRQDHNLCRRGMRQQRKSHQKCRAFAQSAVDANFTAEQACQRHGNFKPQTGAGEFARQTRIDLVEALKQFAQRFLVQAYAGVSH